MRRIAHISDLHFGRVNTRLQDALLADIEKLSPDLVVISGDLTQRAHTKEFSLAKEYLERIPFPSLVIPGNHDIPLYNVPRRFIRPLKRYKEYITEDLNPFYVDDEIAVLGINTARSLTLIHGQITRRQMIDIERQFTAVPQNLFKIVVTHHPFISPMGRRLRRQIAHGATALRTIDRCGVDMILAGHLHKCYTGDISSAYRRVKRPIIVANAGTAISTRVRKEPNSFNLVTIEGDKMQIAMHAWDGAHYVESRMTDYLRGNSVGSSADILVHDEELVTL
ncbi:MAG TPA: metallophosphoesterase [Candidatus Peribacteraceae bacterium]|nr:metallophosphoesterase [Candidatus Peribacteraceae bacterium]